MAGVKPGQPTCRLLFGAAFCCALAATALAVEPLPWETWTDLRRLGQLQLGHQSLLRGSRCPSGCRYDRHSAGDWRYIRVDGDEGVIFEETGPGAITRIWMTSGSGTSVPLDPSIQIRVYLDGQPTPVVDVPLPALFDGSNPPFVLPLVGDRLSSSGACFSYVPIPYRAGCRVVLVGADDYTLWFQLGFHRLDSASNVTTFTGTEDLTSWSTLLSLQGEDPWLATGTLPPQSHELDADVEVGPGETAVLLSLPGPDTATLLRLTLDQSAWGELELRLTFDGERTVAMPLTDFFAQGRGGTQPTRSLLVGQDALGALYSYFPMPFTSSAVVEVFHAGQLPAAPVLVHAEARVDGVPPAATAAPFGASLAVEPELPADEELTVVDLVGHGRLVGLFMDLQSVGTPSRTYLEGDEKLYLDGAVHPMLYGTGVEDLFNGGFYFDQGPFGRALHGAPYTALVVGDETATGAYRLMLSDAVSFGHSLRLRVEGGPGPPTGHVAMRARAVAYHYLSLVPALHVTDRLDLGSETSRAVHAWAPAGA